MSDDDDFTFPRARGRRTTTPGGTTTPTTRKRTPKKRLRTPTEIEAALTKQLSDITTLLSTASRASNNPTLYVDAQIVKAGTENFARSWAELSDQNQRVHVAVDAFISSAAWSTTLGSTVAIIVPILINHGLLPNWFKSDSSTVVPVVPIKKVADDVPPEDVGHVEL